MVLGMIYEEFFPLIKSKIIILGARDLNQSEFSKHKSVLSRHKLNQIF